MSWIEQRAQRIESAIRFLKGRCVLVTVANREHPIRTYRVSGRRELQLAEDVIAMAQDMGWDVLSAEGAAQ
jgi:hypothetical protein